MQQDLVQIKAWLQAHAPATLAQLNPGASISDLEQLEQGLGMPLPESLKQFLMQHDGDDALGCDAFWGDFNVMLSCQQILQQYHLDQEIGQQLYDPSMETIEFWRDRIQGRIIFVKGAVKPLMLHPGWIPLTNMNGDVIRYLDYDPAPGGIKGQIIEVDPENCSYQVIADSFEDLLRRYRLALEAGEYRVDTEGYIERIDIDQDVMAWGMPNWLVPAK